MRAEFTNIEIVINVFDIIKTIEEALTSVLSNPTNAFLLNDIQAGLSRVSDSIRPMEIENSAIQKDIREQLDKLPLTIKNENVIIDALLIQVKAFSLHYQLFSMHAIFDNLTKTEACSAEIAEKIFAFCDEYPVQLAHEKSVLVWSCALKSGKSMPREAYERTMNAFSMNPSLHQSLQGVNMLKYQPYPTEYRECCPMCGEKGVPYYMAPQILAVNYEPIFQPAKLWMKCKKCETLFAYNFPKLLQEDYIGCDSTADVEQILPRYQLNIFGNILNNIQRYAEGKTLLEVGIGNGELALTAREMGFEVDAVEISIKEAHKAREQLGLEVTCCDFLEFQSNKKYDVITMGDVLEHVESPLLALEKARELLNPKGILWLSTPNYNSAFSRYHQFKDPMWKEPWHVTYFSREALLPYLEELSFTVLQYNISERYNGSMELVLRVGQWLKAKCK